VNVDGLVTPAADFEAADDDEALELVKSRNDKTDCDLWCGKRPVAFLPQGKAPIREADWSPAI